MGVIGFLALAANFTSVLLLMSYKDGDANVRSVWLCSRNDAIGNIAVMAAALGVFGTGTAWPDLIVAALLALLGISGGIQIVQQAWLELRRTARLLQHIAWPLVHFIPLDDAAFDRFQPGGRYKVKLRLCGMIPFGTQWIVTSLHEAEGSEWPKRLRDNGHSALIPKWDHWITVTPDPNGGTRYSDEVEVSAGALTPLIWAFAQIFYRHRQRRWRKLAESLASRRVIAAEMAAYHSAVQEGDDGTRAASKAMLLPVALAALVASPAFGQDLTLEEAIRRALTAAPQNASVAAQVDALKANRAAADLPPRPSLEIATENFGPPSDSLYDQFQITGTYSQQIERGGKRQARVTLADRQIDVAMAQAVVRRLEFISDVQLAYVEVQAAEAAIGVARERLAIAQGVATEVDRRVASARDPIF
ncbi:hypothetical protein A4X03_0g8730, partial [Tilletia caries]